MIKIIDFLWQLPQNLLGFILIKIIKPTRWYAMKFDRAFWITSRHKFTITLGRFIVIGIKTCDFDYIKLNHEKGHQELSRKWGWLYLPVVALTMFMRKNYLENHLDFLSKEDKELWWYSSWPESEADRLGGVVRY